MLYNMSLFCGWTMVFKMMESVVFTSSSIRVHKHFLISTEKMLASPEFPLNNLVAYLKQSKKKALIENLGLIISLNLR